jgi:hypothetical protein
VLEIMSIVVAGGDVDVGLDVGADVGVLVWFVTGAGAGAVVVVGIIVGLEIVFGIVVSLKFVVVACTVADNVVSSDVVAAVSGDGAGASEVE